MSDNVQLHHFKGISRLMDFHHRNSCLNILSIFKNIMAKLINSFEKQKQYYDCNNYILSQSYKRKSFLWGRYYKTFYGRNLRIFVINQSSCPRQTFPVQSNVWGQAQVLTRKHQTRLERLAREKHSILLRKFVNYGHRKFYSTGPTEGQTLQLNSPRNHF